MAGNYNVGEIVQFHGYLVYIDGTVASKKTMRPLKTHLRRRRGGGYCVRVMLYYDGKRKQWPVHRLVAACFLGPIDGYEINHKDRNTNNNHVDNLERVTASENQNHWRNFNN